MSDETGTYAGFTFPQIIHILPKLPLAKRLAEFKLTHGKRVCGPYYRNRPAENPTGAVFYLESDFMPGLRWQWADEVENSGIKHNGWYSDEFGDSDLIRGIVMRLPHNGGFLPGWSMGEGMASEVAYDVYQEEADAAREADRLAEHVAENAREEDARERERMRLEEEAEEVDYEN